MNAMRKPFLTKIKKTLEEQYQELLHKCSQSLHEIDASGDEVDLIQARILSHSSIQLASREKERLVKIQTALKKIAAGTFGSCEECGEDIAEKRLLFNPCFITCIGCAEHNEILARRR